MKLIAITGSIGCGKTTIAGLIRRMGYAVYDVDAWVRRLYSRKSFIRVIDKHFPGMVKDGVVNKRRLRNLVFSDAEELKRLESLIHPFLKQNLRRVIRRNARCCRLIFLDVALLFEMGWDKYCHTVLLATVDYELQKQRVMTRDKVTAEDFEKINRVQLSKESKILLSDIIIDTDQPKNKLSAELMTIIDKLEEQ